MFRKGLQYKLWVLVLLINKRLPCGNCTKGLSDWRPSLAVSCTRSCITYHCWCRRVFIFAEKSTAETTMDGKLTTGFHIVVSDRYASQSVERWCYWDAYLDLGTLRRMVSLTSQLRWENLRSVQILRMSPMHRPSCPCRCWDVPVDAGTSPSMLGRPRRLRRYGNQA